MRDVDTHYKDFREKDKCLENVPSDPDGNAWLDNNFVLFLT